LLLHHQNGRPITTYVITLSPIFVFITTDTVVLRNVGSQNHLRPFIRDLFETWPVNRTTWRRRCKNEVMLCHALHWVSSAVSETWSCS